MPLKNQIHVKNKLNSLKMPPTAPRGTVKEELKSLNMINDRTNGMDLSEIINITENAREASKSKNMNLSSISK